MSGHGKTDLEADGQDDFEGVVQQTAQKFPCYRYNGKEWDQSQPILSQQQKLLEVHSTLTVASYNASNEIHRLVRSILDADADVDVLVLQGVAASSLSFLLHDKQMQDRYAFCTHGPANADPPRAQSCTVVFSKYALGCEVITLPTGNANHYIYNCKTKCVSFPLDIPIIDKQPSSWHGEKVLKALRKRGGIPDGTARASRARALRLLESVLLGSLPPGVGLRIVTVGSYALDVWTASSNLDCLCIGSFSRSTFIEFATARLRQAGSQGIILLRRLETQAGTALKLEVRSVAQMEDIRVDLTYAPSEWPLPDSDTTLSTSPETRWALRAFREVEYVQQSVRDIRAFRLAHRFIRLWAEGRGIYSARLGYLSGVQITILLTRVIKLLTRHGEPSWVPGILITFFKEYASFDWKKGMVFDEFFHTDPRYFRTGNEPLVILGYFQPTLNASLAASTSTIWTMEREFRRQHELIEPMLRQDAPEELVDSSGFGVGLMGQQLIDFEDDREKRRKDRGFDWHSLLGENATFYPGDGLGGCLSHNYKMHIRISAQYWGGSVTKGRAFISWLESRFKSLLVDLKMAAPDRRFTFWPVRFAEKDVDEQTAGRYMYVCGVDWAAEVDQKPQPGDDIDLSRRLEAFRREIESDTRRFDSNCLGFDIGHVALGSSDPTVGHTDLDDHQVDSRNWDAYLPVDEDDESQGEAQGTSVESDWHAPAQNKTKNKFTTNQPRSAVVPKKEGAGKFRPAADVLNRLRWDPAYDLCDFVVGYEDRFAGVMEKGLDGWKLEQTHEEFIPQHRILYFKRMSDEAVVWERRTRVDLVFGSG